MNYYYNSHAHIVIVEILSPVTSIYYWWTGTEGV